MFYSELVPFIIGSPTGLQTFNGTAEKPQFCTVGAFQFCMIVAAMS